MKITPELPPTEIEEFNKKFCDANKSYKISSNMMGKILSIETEDQEILNYIKERLSMPSRSG